MTLLQMLELSSVLPKTPEDVLRVDDRLRAEARLLDADQLETMAEVAALLVDAYARIGEIARIEAARRKLVH